MFKRVLTMVPTSRTFFGFQGADNKEILRSKKEKGGIEQCQVCSSCLPSPPCVLPANPSVALQRGGVPAPASLASLDAAAWISAMLVRCGGGGVVKQEQKRVILEDA